MGIAAIEWATLAGYGKGTRILFVAATLAIGILLLVSLAAGDESRWADVVLTTCGAATISGCSSRHRGSRFAGACVQDRNGGRRLDRADRRLGRAGRAAGTLALARACGDAVVWIADTAAYFAGARSAGTSSRRR